MVTRRRFLTQTGSIGLVPWLITSAGCGSSASGDKEPSGAPPDVGAAFLHGVASGDPLADGVILWTRVTLEGDGAKGEPVDVDWRIGLDPEVYDPDTGRGSLGVEIIVPGVTSPGIGDRAEAARSEERYREMAPHLAFTEQHSQGYVIVDLTHERARAEWHFVSSVRQPEALERLGGAVQVGAGENHLIPA